jgi:hypothetical protein
MGAKSEQEEETVNNTEEQASLTQEARVLG